MWGLVKNRLTNALSGIWAIPLVFTMRLVRPIRLIQICGILSSRIGHFVADSAEQKVKATNLNPNVSTLFFLQGTPANVQWETMVRRTLPNLRGNWLSYVFKWNQKIPGGRIHTLESSQSESRDTEGYFQKYDCSFPFTREENDSCKK
jgi:hypothetical protein